MVLGRWTTPTGSGNVQGQVNLTPLTQSGVGGVIVAEQTVTVPLTNNAISQVVASLNHIPQLQVSEQVIGSPTYAYVISPPTARTDTVTNTQGTSTITDAAIGAGDAGKAVAGTGVPIVSYVGTVNAGVSFTLTDASGNPVNTTAPVTSIVVGAVDLTTIARGTGPTVPTYVPSASVGAIGGPAGPLDGTGRVPAAQIPPVASGVQSVTAASGKIVIGGTLSNPTVDVGTGIPESAITNLTTDLGNRALLPVIRQTYFTSGDVAFPNTSGAFAVINQATSGTFEVDVPASAGHWIEVDVAELRTTDAAALLDVGVIVGSTVVRYLSTGTSSTAADGDISFYSDPANFFPHGGSRGFSATSGDLDAGNVRVVLLVNSNGTGTLKCSAANQVTILVKNLGPHS